MPAIASLSGGPMMTRPDTMDVPTMHQQADNISSTDPEPLAGNEVGLCHEMTAEIRRGVFVVIPAFNEATCIKRVVEAVRSLYSNVVVVDDGSDDRTLEAAREAGALALR